MVALGQLVSMIRMVGHLLVHIHFVTCFQEFCPIQWYSPEKKPTLENTISQLFFFKRFAYLLTTGSEDLGLTLALGGSDCTLGSSP